MRPFHRYVALGDSFTEGLGDPDPGRPHGLRGWADRVAEVLAAGHEPGAPPFGYANLAIRGRKLTALLEEQVGPAIALGPDLVTVHGGGNDVLRPRVDLDAVASAYDAAVARLVGAGAHVCHFTIQDPGRGGLYSALRGRMAVFNEHVREIHDRHGTTLVDLWRVREQPVAELMGEDRMHLAPRGHALVAAAVLDALGVPHRLEAPPAAPPLERSRVARLRDDATWTRDFALPWVHRRLTGRSSGDGLSPRRPTLEPISPPVG